MNRSHSVCLFGGALFAAGATASAQSPNFQFNEVAGPLIPSSAYNVALDFADINPTIPAVFSSQQSGAENLAGANVIDVFAPYGYAQYSYAAFINYVGDTTYSSVGRFTFAGRSSSVFNQYVQVTGPDSARIGIFWEGNDYLRGAAQVTVSIWDGTQFVEQFNSQDFLDPDNSFADRGWEVFTLEQDEIYRITTRAIVNAQPASAIAGYIVPTPAAAGLLGMGGLIAARRRRA